MAFVVFAGQSNTGGAYMTASTLTQAWTPDPKTLIWNGGAQQWETLQPGVNTGYGGMENAWGPETQFAREFRAAHPDEVLHIVKEADGGTGLNMNTGQWVYDWAPGSADELFARTARLVDAASANLGGAWPQAVFWGQGEEDSANAAGANAYAANLPALFTAIRSQWMHDANGKIGFFETSPNLPFGGLVRAAQEATDAADANATAFDPRGLALQGDGLHFAASGYETIGHNEFSLFEGWRSATPTPVAPPPVVTPPVPVAPPVAPPPPEPVAPPAVTAPTPPGAPALWAANGGDTVTGGSADEQIHGSLGTDFLFGMGGADTLNGGEAFDRMNGNQGADVLHGDAGADWVSGGQDNDLVFGDEGDDAINGNVGADTVDGGAGNDIVRGGQGDDLLTGGATGADWLSGDLGNDTMSGGMGADVFHASAQGGVDRVLDFNFAEGDRVQLDAGMHYSAHQDGADTVVDLGGGNELLLANVQMSSLGSGWIFGA
jgi:Ca2+-binding RTX toxin-like protein